MSTRHSICGTNIAFQSPTPWVMKNRTRWEGKYHKENHQDSKNTKNGEERNARKAIEMCEFVHVIPTTYPDSGARGSKVPRNHRSAVAAMSCLAPDQPQEAADGKETL